MLKDIRRLISCGNEESQKIVEEIAKKNNCSVEKVYWTVRSMYGKKLKECRWDFREPSREDFIKAVYLSDDKDSLRACFPKICNRQWSGIYDRVLGVSTYSKAVEMAAIELTPKINVPTTDNNMAMWAAFRLGDGSYDPKRNSWKIEHCAKQEDWLYKKVELFHRAFPQSSTKVVHNEGRNTFSWYSCKVGQGKFRKIGVCNKVDCVKHLNHFGMFILFMDDGHNFSTQYGVSFAVENMSIAIALRNKLKEYGFEFRIASKNDIRMTGVENVVRFHKAFTEPFVQQTPECMMYKHFVKI